jgi:hypothetical protein
MTVWVEDAAELVAPTGKAFDVEQRRDHEHAIGVRDGACVIAIARSVSVQSMENDK